MNVSILLLLTLRYFGEISAVKHKSEQGQGEWNSAVVPFGKLSVVEGISEEVAFEWGIKMMKGRCEKCEQLEGAYSRQRAQLGKTLKWERIVLFKKQNHKKILITGAISLKIVTFNFQHYYRHI